ncbi:hypothetical protein CYR55_02885 [Chimaeribacter californicus]|uniref:Uncharacterized protein n=1 Tax=Chimaeribacter californicus TaxID=2060067 RepID=A0A2N5EGZ7_9GAMM|nr:hypothetical protein [Chimaeribacter californicus]PLR41785.1 hypothetical protein CYR55_02885 [Chimaeribacter californicus]
MNKFLEKWLKLQGNYVIFIYLLLTLAVAGGVIVVSALYHIAISAIGAGLVIMFVFFFLLNFLGWLKVSVISIV